MAAWPQTPERMATGRDYRPGNLPALRSLLSKPTAGTPRLTRASRFDGKRRSVSCSQQRHNPEQGGAGERERGNEMSTAANAHTVGSVSIESSIDAYAWSRVAEHLDAHGWAMGKKQ